MNNGLPLVKDKVTWSIRYNDGYTDLIDSEEYAWTCHRLIKEREIMHPFIGDSRDYYVLGQATEAIVNVPGLVCEIGLRQGGGSKIIIDTLIASQKERTCIAIDPYGAIPFKGMEGEWLETTEYSNIMQKDTLRKMYDYLLYQDRINFVFFPLEDTEFFQRFADGVPIYAKGKKVVHTQYALVHFDGPHDLETTMEETYFFHDKAPKGAMFVYDDVLHFYDHEVVKDFLLEKGWSQVDETKVKASYIKL